MMDRDWWSGISDATLALDAFRSLVVGAVVVGVVAAEI